MISTETRTASVIISIIQLKSQIILISQASGTNVITSSAGLIMGYFFMKKGGGVVYLRQSPKIYHSGLKILLALIRKLCFLSAVEEWVRFSLARTVNTASWLRRAMRSETTLKTTCRFMELPKLARSLTSTFSISTLILLTLYK